MSPGFLVDVASGLSNKVELTLKWKNIHPGIHEPLEWIPVLIVDLETASRSDHLLKAMGRTIRQYQLRGTACIVLSRSSIGKKAARVLSDMLFSTGTWGTHRVSIEGGMSYSGKVLKVDSEIQMVHLHGLDIHAASKVKHTKHLKVLEKYWMILTAGIAWPRYEQVEWHECSLANVFIRDTNNQEAARSCSRVVRSRLQLIQSYTTTKNQHGDRTCNVAWLKVASLADANHEHLTKIQRSDHFVVDIGPDVGLLKDVVMKLSTGSPSFTITSCMHSQHVLCVHASGSLVGHIVHGLDERYVAMPYGIPEQRGKCGMQTIITLLCSIHADG